MENSKQTNDFSQGKVSSAILRMGIPLTLAQLVNVLYNLVDRMYIGHLQENLAFAGLGLALPAVMLISAFSNLFGTGAAPLCSIERGRGDLEKAKRIQGNAFALLVYTGVALMVLFVIFARPLLYLFGASDATYPYAAAYLRIYVLGTVFVMISSGMNSLINAQGFARTGMMTVMIGAVVNLLLDPLFIFVFDMGVQGAAVATVIAQTCSAVWVFCFLRGKKAILRVDLKAMKLDWSIVKQILGLGVTGVCMAATTALVQATANTQLRRFGGDLYVGVMTALNSIHEVAILAVRGLTNGAQPVLGYNHGAGRPDRVKTGVRFITFVSIGYTALIWLLLMLFPTGVIRIFNSQPELLQVGGRAMRLYFLGFVFMSLQFSGQSVFVGLGRAKYAVSFSLLRKVVIVVVLTLLLPRLWGLGVDGVFLAEPISNLLGGTACFATMYFTVYRKLDASACSVLSSDDAR